MGHKITLSQETINSPIISPIGILAGASYQDGFHYFNSKVIMWNKSPVQRTQWETCEPHSLYTAYAMVTHTQKQGRLIDKSHQLEVLFSPEIKTICEKGTIKIEGYPVFGLPGGFLKLKEEIKHARKQKRETQSRGVTFVGNTEEVQHFVWNPNITKKQLEYMEAVESYDDYSAFGYIFPIGNPSEVLTATKVQSPMILDSRWDGRNGDESFKSQKFRLKNFKIKEDIEEVGLCVSSHDIGKGWDPVIWTKRCDKVYDDEWYKSNDPEWTMDRTKWKEDNSSEWIYDTDNKLLIEIGTGRCLTKSGKEVRLKKCDRKTGDVNQKWDFEHFSPNQIPDSHVDINVKTYDFDESHLDEYLEFIQGKEQVIEVSKQALSYGRLKLFSGTSIEGLGGLRGCLFTKSHQKFSLASVTNCINQNQLYNKNSEDKVQDFEHHFDLTIRPTGSNRCLDVLLPKKKSSRKVLFPSVGDDFINSENISNFKEKMVVLNNCVPGSSRWIYDDYTKQFINLELKSNKVGCLTKNGLILIMDECDDKNMDQKWQFDFKGNGTSVLNANMVRSKDFLKSIGNLPEIDQHNIRFPIAIPKVYKKAINEGKGTPVRPIGPKGEGGSITQPDFKMPPIINPINPQTTLPAEPIQNQSAEKGAEKGRSQEPTTVDKNKISLSLHNVVSHGNGTSSADIPIGQLEDFIKNYLDPLHQQFKAGITTDHENQIAEEVRAVYCKLAETKRTQLMIISQMSPILAAISIGMKPCERIEGHGMSLLLQECKPVTVEIGMFESQNCGPQPIFSYLGANYSVGTDGYSLVKINDDNTGNWCFWRNNHFININGKTHFWKHAHGNITNGNWEIIPPTVHGSHVALVKHFEVLPLNDYDLELRGLNYHEKTEFEQLNILMELTGRAQQFETDHLGAVISNEKREADVQDMFSWTRTLRIIVICIVGFILFAICLRLFILCNPLPLIDNLIIKTKNKIKKQVNNSIETKGSTETADYQKEPTAPPVYASLAASTDFSEKNMSDISIDTINKNNSRKRHNHTKCTYVRGKGLVWSDGCVCGSETNK
jgi:hypothetical protein